MSGNIWRDLMGQIPRGALQIVTVVTVRGDGMTSIVAWPGGGQAIVRGQQVPEGSNAFVRDGEIVGLGPDVLPDTLDV